jgi:hypothetical protein
VLVQRLQHLSRTRPSAPRRPRGRPVASTTLSGQASRFARPLAPRRALVMISSGKIFFVNWRAP